MKFKATLFIFMFLGLMDNIRANTPQENLKNHLAREKQTSSARIANIAAGSITLTMGSAFGLLGLCGLTNHLINFNNKDFDCPHIIDHFINAAFASPVTYSGYHLLNKELNNRPNEFIKSLIQKAKAQLQRPKVNEQK